MKENKIEKFILNLSNRWECSPQEAVDRLNSMNESEINKLITSMTNKFKNGGFINCLRSGGSIPTCKCGKSIKAQMGTSLGNGSNINDPTPDGRTMIEAARRKQIAEAPYEQNMPIRIIDSYMKSQPFMQRAQWEAAKRGSFRPTEGVSADQISKLISNMSGLGLVRNAVKGNNPMSGIGLMPYMAKKTLTNGKR